MTDTTTRERAPQAAHLAGETFDEFRGARSAAAAGVAFVVLNIAGTFAAGSPPASDASTAKIAAYFNDHSGAIKAQLLLGGLGIAALMWWFGALWRLLSRAEGERPHLAIVAAVSLASALTLGIVNGVANATAALRAGDPETTHVLYTLSFVVIAAAGFGLAVFLTATSLVTYRGRGVPRWMSFLGFAAAVAFLVSGAGTVNDSGALSAVGLIAFLIWCVWILAMSTVMWREPVI
jgi:hypothetical protein